MCVGECIVGVFMFCEQLMLNLIIFHNMYLSMLVYLAIDLYPYLAIGLLVSVFVMHKVC